jgi:hypothetical protein
MKVCAWDIVRLNIRAHVVAKITEYWWWYQRRVHIESNVEGALHSLEHVELGLDPPARSQR